MLQGALIAPILKEPHQVAFEDDLLLRISNEAVRTIHIDEDFSTPAFVDQATLFRSGSLVRQRPGRLGIVVGRNFEQVTVWIAEINGVGLLMIDDGPTSDGFMP